MEKRSVFGHRLFPYALLLPQIAITLIFFYWPASQAVWQSFLLQDAFGLSTSFIWFENYRDLFSQPEYFRTIATTLFFSGAVAVLSLSCALLLATQADKHLAGAGVYRTLLIWPYAVAPAVAGVLWAFMFQPSLGVLARALREKQEAGHCVTQDKTGGQSVTRRLREQIIRGQDRGKQNEAAR